MIVRKNLHSRYTNDVLWIHCYDSNMRIAQYRMLDNMSGSQ